jgi:hypothetical protein
VQKSTASIVWKSKPGGEAGLLDWVNSDAGERGCGSGPKLNASAEMIIPRTKTKTSSQGNLSIFFLASQAEQKRVRRPLSLFLSFSPFRGSQGYKNDRLLKIAYFFAKGKALGDDPGDPKEKVTAALLESVKNAAEAFENVHDREEERNPKYSIRGVMWHYARYGEEKPFPVELRPALEMKSLLKGLQTPSRCQTQNLADMDLDETDLAAVLTRPALRACQVVSGESLPNHKPEASRDSGASILQAKRSFPSLRGSRRPVGEPASQR